MVLEDKIRAIGEALDDHKGHDIRALYVGEVSSVCDAFVVVSGGSSSQLEALCDAAEERMRVSDEELVNREGRAEGGWILLDYGDVVVHIFTDESREFYDLEHTWRDAKRVDFSAF